MATIYKVLGQAAPAANTPADLYVVNTTGAVVSSIIVANRSSSVTAYFDISVSVAGAATTTKDYIYYGITIGQRDTFIATVGLTLSAGDIIRVNSTTANLSFQAFGSEIS